MDSRLFCMDKPLAKLVVAYFVQVAIRSLTVCRACTVRFIADLFEHVAVQGPVYPEWTNCSSEVPIMVKSLVVSR